MKGFSDLIGVLLRIAESRVEVRIVEGGAQGLWATIWYKSMVYR